jgi:acetolactate synthase-1/2/3 large subunit
MDSSPVIALTGQVPAYSHNTSYMVGRDSFQEADIVGITTPITKYGHQVRNVKEIPKMVKTAFYIATTGRPGPVLVDFPKDIQNEIADIDFTQEPKLLGYNPQCTIDELGLKKAAKMLLEAQRPIILAGGGVIIGNASQELLQLSEFLRIPVVTTLMGKGSIPENHPLALGDIGMHGTQAANKLVIEADLLLAVGTRFSDRSCATNDTFCQDKKIIHIDIDLAEIEKNISVHLPIVGEAKCSLQMLYNIIINQIKKKKDTPWAKRVKEVQEELQNNNDNESKTLKPKALLKKLRELLPADSIATTEVGQNQMWAGLFFQALQPRTFITSGGLGTMGFGFPAAIGAKVACPNRTVIDIAGDGSFIMTEQELACAVEENIPVIVMVFNNTVLGNVAQWQRMLYKRRYTAVNLGKVPNFVKLAEAYGAQGILAQSIEEFAKAIKTAMKSEIPISPEENIFPMVPPGSSLKEVINGDL